MRPVLRVVPAGATSKPKADGSADWGFFGITEIPDHDDPSKTYLKRWRLIETPYLGVKVHHILLSDNPETRGLHDHPWSFVSVRLSGNYTELRPGERFERCFGRWGVASGVGGGVYRWRRHRFLNLVRSTDLHAVRLHDDKPCWTLVINGPRRREWGFRFPGRPWTVWYRLDGPHAVNARGKAGSTVEVWR